MSSFTDQIEKDLADNDIERLGQTIYYLGLSETLDGAMSHDIERIIKTQQHLSQIEAIIKTHIRRTAPEDDAALKELLAKIKLYSEFHYIIINALPDQRDIDEIVHSRQGKLILEILAYIDEGGLPRRRHIEKEFNLSRSQANKILYKMRSLGLIYAYIIVPKQGYVYRTELGGRKILKMMEFVRNIPALKLVEINPKKT